MTDISQTHAAEKEPFDLRNVPAYAGLALAGVMQIAWMAAIGYGAWLVVRASF